MNHPELTELERTCIVWAEKQLEVSCTITREVDGHQNAVFKLQAAQENFFLKIGSHLENELERLHWLEGKLPVPKVIGRLEVEGKQAVLLSAIEGKSLAVLVEEWSAEKVIEKFAQALHRFHDVDITTCPFGAYDSKKVLVHGDATLPHFIFQGDEFSGYVDLGEVQMGNQEMDLSAAVWSLQYNLGPGHGLNFLREYGVKDLSEEYVEWLRMRYDDLEQAWEF